MSERKVLNKYYPPDYDPTKLPKLGLSRDRQYVIRTMAPFNMRCKTCGEYIYKGKKFNSRKETVHSENYLGLPIFRFYIKCTRCISEITYKTDLENCDYAIEHGATRLFEAERLASKAAKLEEKQEEEDALNPMKVLEKRTKDSHREMEILESLDELKEMNKRRANTDVLEDTMLVKYAADREAAAKRQEDEDEEFVRSVFNGEGGTMIKRIADDDESSDDEEKEASKRQAKLRKLEKLPNFKPSDILTNKKEEKVQKKEAWEKSAGTLSKKSMSAFVKRKQPAAKDESKDDREDRKAFQTAPSSSSLSLLGNYSDSSESDS